MARPESVRIVEVGPRDGLQNEAAHIPTDVKISFIDKLSQAGYRVIEATSFVHPKVVPQLADADEVFRAIQKAPGVRYPVLVPTKKGLVRAMEAGATEIALFIAATDSFNQANINRTTEEALEDAQEVITLAMNEGIWVRAYVSTAFGCPYEGPVAPSTVRDLAERLLELGADEVAIGDTIGVATPGDVARLLEEVLQVAPPERWGMHFHDTRGTALANVMASLDFGVFIFDSSAGGLGGCPFAGPNAAGNLATEDLVYLLDGMGIEHGVDLDRVLEASRFIAGAVGHPLTSKVFQAGGRLVPRPLAAA
jgi:hydroxymethylglutaryl-CoA lyase